MPEKSLPSRQARYQAWKVFMMLYDINSQGRDSIQLADVVPIHNLSVNAVMLQSLVVRVPRPPELDNRELTLAG
jgi:hypothetical protein